ncbi:hypothetical protein [Thiolapillus sp.]
MLTLNDRIKEEKRLVEALKKEGLDQLIRAYYERRLSWIRRGAPKEEAIPEDVQERMQFTADYKIPARFKHLQYLNKGKGPEFD